ncbi:hypothetical protein LOTGIDRAFT_143268 [Lottia gigantea]|uniref:SAC domain-containing protein n=1 Tax=Lottia gigantea TaxID=225164 RepID=V4C8H3_LOTGI|nr:hypothetical protein LOTGIDRAFT_143268 [Lottia gigantea]ESO98034.1 hypothetical protein LOTGIDRAFT_143268 [Lottia gigantea]
MEVPIISSLQKIILYESKMRFYIVGSNVTETRFRVLKIDRTEPRELHIQDDKIEYDRDEVINVLTTLDHGNRTKGKGTGIRQTLSAYGIFGFVRFLEGYYVVLITKRSCKQLIGPHAIYKIEDTSMVYIPNDAVRYFHPLESRYVKIFQTMDLSSDFYFSYSYDLTNTLQYNMIPAHIPNTSNSGSQHNNGSQHNSVIGVRGQPSWKFVWNRHLLKGYWDVVHTDWVLFITHGFIGQCKLDVYGKPIYITLIGRRSNQYAGTRFLKRGSNCKGAVANEIETEQIVHDGSRTFLDKGCISSFTQVRGSVPLSWSQDVVKMVPKPAILMDKRDPYAEVAGLHFNGLLKRYGAPIIVLNLVKRREKRAHESILKEELMETIKYLNQFLPPQHALQYIGFDMAHVSKRKNGDVLVRLAKIAKYCIKQTGFYLHLPPGCNGSIKHDERLKSLNNKWTINGCRQNGTVRTNCVDCLDRTNTAQFAVGKCALAYQLYCLGVIEETELDFDTDCVRMLEMLYEDHGDTVALQYGGSQLVHRIKGYRKIAPWTEHSRDIMQTLSRYYSNAFSDLEKQQAINLFLGIFVPQEDKANIWELTTDYYLHNNNCTKLLGNCRKLYSQWWDNCVIEHLPFSADEEMKKDCLSVCQTSLDDERVNEFDEYYKPWTLTILEDLTCFKLSNSMRNFMQKGTGTKEMSPFTVRVLPTHITDSVNLGGKNPNISGKDSTMSVGSEGSTSSSDDSDVEGEMCLSDSTSECHSDGESSYISLQDIFPSMKTVYKYDISEPSKRDQNLYQRYVDLGKKVNVNKKSKQLKPSLELFAVSAFKLDSCYSVEPPPISKHARDIYQAYIDRGCHGPGKPRDKDYIMYQKYVGSKYG